MKPKTLVIGAIVLLCAGYAAYAFMQPGKPTVSTAQAGVSLLPTELNMPELGRTRKIRLYLPPGYATSGKHYPVLYMHDGQNLFDAVTAYADEWQVDEAMDALARDGKLEAIVVGIDNGQEKRMTELNPFDHPEFGKGEGKGYLSFIVNTVKPMIDARYRTKPDRANTAVMGSSMGGLISHYAMLQHPTVFSKAGIFSPSYPIGHEMFKAAAAKPGPTDARMYLLVGTKEGDEMVKQAVRMREQLVKMGHPEANTTVKVVRDGEHSEAFWRSEFREALLWMFAEPAK
jgi:predicted alpha/beta superfamily hydrolase